MFDLNIISSKRISFFGTNIEGINYNNKLLNRKLKLIKSSLSALL